MVGLSFCLFAVTLVIVEEIFWINLVQQFLVTTSIHMCFDLGPSGSSDALQMLRIQCFGARERYSSFIWPPSRCYIYNGLELSGLLRIRDFQQKFCKFREESQIENVQKSLDVCQNLAKLMLQSIPFRPSAVILGIVNIDVTAFESVFCSRYNGFEVFFLP